MSCCERAVLIGALLFLIIFMSFGRWYGTVSYHLYSTPTGNCIIISLFSHSKSSMESMCQLFILLYMMNHTSCKCLVPTVFRLLSMLYQGILYQTCTMIATFKIILAVIVIVPCVDAICMFECAYKKDLHASSK